MPTNDIKDDTKDRENDQCTALVVGSMGAQATISLPQIDFPDGLVC